MQPNTCHVDYDPARRLVHMSCTGLWSLEQIRRFKGEVKAILERIRRDGRGARIFADNSAAAVQTQEVMAEIADFIATMYLPEDRHAIVVNSCLAKMQMRRAAATAVTEIFLSPGAAMTWLLAYEPLPIGSARLERRAG